MFLQLKKCVFIEIATYSKLSKTYILSHVYFQMSHTSPFETLFSSKMIKEQQFVSTVTVQWFHIKNNINGSIVNVGEALTTKNDF